MPDGKQDVLVVGAGPVGFLLACELARRGVGVRIIDKLVEPSPMVRAVGVASRTLEIFDDLGVLDAVLAAGQKATHSRAFVQGKEVMSARIDGFDAPYPFTLHLAQPDTERILTEFLAKHGVQVERGCTLLHAENVSEHVHVGLRRGDDIAEQAEYAYVVGCDGAHSNSRKALGLPFEGEAYPLDLMLADAVLDWSVPHDGVSRLYSDTGFVVAVTIPGDPKRFRVSAAIPVMRVEDGGPVFDATETVTETKRPLPSAAEVEAFVRERGAIDVKVEKLIWTSYFRISLRQAPQYRVGRVFLAGDAAHIHPPTGGQGMNTGLQDAYNLGWKLALAVQGSAATGLLDSYHAERHPIGADTLRRTHEASMHLLQPPTDPADDEKAAVVNSMLLLNYRGSPIVSPAADVPPSIRGGDPQPGDRAPDARLVDALTGKEQRVFDLLRGTKHTLLLYVDKPGDKDAVRRATELAGAIKARRGSFIAPHVILAGAVVPPKAAVLLDKNGAFRRAYGPSSLFLVRPDQYIGFRSAGLESGPLNAHLRGILA